MADYVKIFEAGWKLRNDGNYPAGQELLEQHLPKAEENNDLEGLSYLLKLKAQLACDQKDHELALTVYKRLEKVFIERQDKQKQMHTLRHIGQTFLELGKPECAEKCLIQVVESYEASDVSKLEKANSYRAYANALSGMGKDQEASKQIQKAESIYTELGIAT